MYLCTVRGRDLGVNFARLRTASLNGYVLWFLIGRHCKPVWHLTAAVTSRIHEVFSPLSGLAFFLSSFCQDLVGELNAQLPLLRHVAVIYRPVIYLATPGLRCVVLVMILRPRNIAIQIIVRFLYTNISLFPTFSQRRRFLSVNNKIIRMNNNRFRLHFRRVFGLVKALVAAVITRPFDLTCYEMSFWLY